MPLQPPHLAALRWSAHHQAWPAPRSSSPDHWHQQALDRCTISTSRRVLFLIATALVAPTFLLMLLLVDYLAKFGLHRNHQIEARSRFPLLLLVKVWVEPTPCSYKRPTPSLSHQCIWNSCRNWWSSVDHQEVHGRAVRPPSEYPNQWLSFW